MVATAGRGGNGGICSNVFVTLPEAMTGQLRVLTRPALGGAGGAGGSPGRGGIGGAAAGHPSAAAAGSAGQAGRDGLARPAPQVFVNARPLEGRTTSP
jgi:hypothetical protein